MTSGRSSPIWPYDDEPVRLHRKPSPEEVGVLGLIAEEGAIPIDQLARFLKRESGEVERVLAPLREDGFARREQLLARRTRLVWLGTRGAGSSQTGIVEPQLRIGALPLMRATQRGAPARGAAGPEARCESYRSLMH